MAWDDGAHAIGADGDFAHGEVTGVRPGSDLIFGCRTGQLGAVGLREGRDRIVITRTVHGESNLSVGNAETTNRTEGECKDG